MINIWHDIDPSRVTPENFTAVIEIPAGSKKKYELDKQTGLLRLDRILYTSTHYPANYGFIPRTYAGDGDPLDVLVLCSETLDPMVEVDCYPIGVIRMIDDDEIDDYFDEIRDQIIQLIREADGRDGRKLFDLIMVTKYLERIGDHATNIAEWVEFAITGVHKDSAVMH